MAHQMNETERLQALEQYFASEHLIKIKGKDGTLKDYYPAAYRLYELNLRYPNANFASDVIFFDVEKNICIVKVRLYLGAGYETSDKKAEAHKSGLLTALDKVETAAKARAARDFGISTEFALDMDDEQATLNLGAIKAEVRKLKLVSNPEQWFAWKREALGDDIPDEKLSQTHLQALAGRLEQVKRNQAA